MSAQVPLLTSLTPTYAARSGESGVGGAGGRRRRRSVCATCMARRDCAHVNDMHDRAPLAADVAHTNAHMCARHSMWLAARGRAPHDHLQLETKHRTRSTEAHQTTRTYECTHIRCTQPHVARRCGTRARARVHHTTEVYERRAWRRRRPVRGFNGRGQARKQRAQSTPQLPPASRSLAMASNCYEYTAR